MTSRARVERADLQIACAVGAAIAGYLLAWPHDLNSYDESIFLYESTRVLHGDVLYRDLFEISMPAAHYLMAVLFRLFGTDIATARAAMALVHGGMGALVYLVTRALAVRRGVALVVGMAPLALAYPFFPQASPHWFGALLTVGVAAALVLRRPSIASRWWLCPGLLVGLLFVTQHQKAIVVGAVLGMLLVAESWIDGPGRRTMLFLGRAGWCAAGALGVVVAGLGPLVALAGWTPIMQLVTFRSVTYRAANHAAWGASFGALDAAGTLLVCLPVVLVACAIGVVVEMRRGKDVRLLVRAVALGAAGFLSVAYYPDVSHLALASPPAFVLLGVVMEWALGACERRIGDPGWFGALAAGAAALVLGGQLARLLVDRGRTYSAAYASPFGRIDLENPLYGKYLERLRALIEERGIEEVFAYPTDPGIYLLTGTKNATRFQILVRGYNTPEHFSEVIGTLTTRQVPLLVVSPWFLNPPRRDTLVLYARQLYREVDLGPRGPSRPYWVFEWTGPRVPAS